MLAGFGLIDPGWESLGDRLELAEEKLRPAAAASADRLDDMDDRERARLASQFSKGLALAREVLAAIEEARLFLSAANLATLRTWGAREDAVVKIYVRRANEAFHLGSAEDGSVKIPLPVKAIDERLPPLPAISAGVDEGS